MVHDKPAKADRNQHRLSFNEQHELDELPDRIAKLEAYIDQANTFLADPDAYTRDPVKFEKAIDRLAEAKAAVTARLSCRLCSYFMGKPHHLMCSSVC